jgi:hypothetical protein
MVSCGEDKNWMIWNIQDQTFENKGMISGLHSRAIYSCSWSKGQVKSPDGISDLQIDLIATVSLGVSMMILTPIGWSR